MGRMSLLVQVWRLMPPEIPDRLPAREAEVELVRWLHYWWEHLLEAFVERQDE